MPSTLTTNRSEMPPFCPLNASCLPSGLNTGDVMPFRFTRMRRTALRRFGSKMTMSSPPLARAAKVRYLLSGDHEAVELMYRKVS